MEHIKFSNKVAKLFASTKYSSRTTVCSSKEKPSNGDKNYEGNENTFKYIHLGKAVSVENISAPLPSPCF
jgi:hypothetical protein